jgi:hypothetical protein
MEIKNSTALSLKKSDENRALVVIATLNTKDKDGDVLLPGAFGDQTVPVVGAHDWHMPPIGKAHVYEEGNEALADIQFNGTDEGKNWYQALRFDWETPPPKAEYSWGFMVPPGNTHRGDFNGEQVRFLHADGSGHPLVIAEVSPVLRAASTNTRTLAIKAEEKPQATPEPVQGRKRPSFDTLIPQVKELINHLTLVHDMRVKDGKRLGAETIKSIDELSTAWQDLRRLARLPDLSQGYEAQDQAILRRHAEHQAAQKRQRAEDEAELRARDEAITQRQQARLNTLATPMAGR